VRDLMTLLRWNHGYDGDNFLRAMTEIEPYRSKLIVCKSSTAALEQTMKRSQQR